MSRRPYRRQQRGAKVARNALRPRATRKADSNSDGTIDPANIFYYNASWRLLEERIADGINLAQGSGRLAAFIGHSRPPRPCGGQLGRVIDHDHPLLVVAPSPIVTTERRRTQGRSRRGRREGLEAEGLYGRRAPRVPRARGWGGLRGRCSPIRDVRVG